jgi:5'-3' exonuclease
MEKILLIDGWNVLIAQNAVSYLTDYNSNPIGMYLTTLNQIRTFVEKFKPSKVLFILDGPEAGERRRQVYPNYKGKRRIKERVSKVQIMDDGDNMVYGVEGAFQNQLIKTFEFLKLLPVSILSVPYAEADDVISYLALKNKDKYKNIIISNDKDYLQLVSENIYVYRWKSKVLYSPEAFSQEYKIRAEHYIYKKVLLGDAGDMVEGIKGIGEKTFSEVSLEFMKEENNFKTLDDFMTHFSQLDLGGYSTRTRNAIKKAFVDNQEKMRLLYNIMKLDEGCMIGEQKELLAMQLNEQVEKKFSRMSAKVKLQKDQFNKLYPNFNDDAWLQPFAFVKSGVVIET